jgi:hypothetical protein
LILARDQPDVAMGYLWRYLGDGGGIGIVFFMAAATVGLKSRPVLAGVGTASSPPQMVSSRRSCRWLSATRRAWCVIRRL